MSPKSPFSPSRKGNVNSRHTYENRDKNEGLTERILEKEGKKQHKIMNFCWRMMKKLGPDDKLYLSYADRYQKASKRKLEIIKKWYGL
ncbi:MAG: hypothetical protein NPMRTH1_270031 [Nitrosopumilales archaeon]|nr:MAG: hypothetical protein NPMRTH1_270031 [Nitrosopumilales archaeon]